MIIIIHFVRQGGINIEYLVCYSGFQHTYRRNPPPLSFKAPLVDLLRTASTWRPDEWGWPDRAVAPGPCGARLPRAARWPGSCVGGQRAAGKQAPGHLILELVAYRKPPVLKPPKRVTRPQRLDSPPHPTVSDPSGIPLKAMIITADHL